MNNDKNDSIKKRPGPKPELISLYPFTFDEVLDTVLVTKPKKRSKKDEDDREAKCDKE